VGVVGQTVSKNNHPGWKGLKFTTNKSINQPAHKQTNQHTENVTKSVEDQIYIALQVCRILLNPSRVVYYYV
jgi:hypothetical protein